MKRVLLVNDDMTVINRTASMLEDIGCEVYTADTREHVETSCLGNGLDTAIVDIEMRGGSGFEMIATIRRTRADILIVAVTRGGHRELWPRVAEACGAARYVAGPVSANKLLNAVSPEGD